MAIQFRPCGDITLVPVPRGPSDHALRERLEKALGLEITVSEKVDYEDWSEPAAMLDAILSTGVEVHLLKRVPLPEAIADPDLVVPGRPCPDILMGRLLSSDMRHFDLVAWPTSNQDLANHYAELATFHQRAGRALRLADMPGDPEMAAGRKRAFTGAPEATDLGTAVVSIGQDAIIKQVYPAKVLPLVHLPVDADTTAAQAKAMFAEEVGYHIIRFEGDPAALLVQERVTMTHETRFFVVGGNVITGAACIEAHTPLQNRGGSLDPIFELRRNGGEFTESVEIADQLSSFVIEVAAQIAQEAPELDSYVIDVALGDEGPLVIELNPIHSSGLYGINAHTLATHILMHVESREDMNNQEMVQAAE